LSFTYIRFKKGIRAQGIRDLPFQAKGGLYTAYWALGATSTIILLQGFENFIDEFHITDFLAAYRNTSL